MGKKVESEFAGAGWPPGGEKDGSNPFKGASLTLFQSENGEVLERGAKYRFYLCSGKEREHIGTEI